MIWFILIGSMLLGIMLIRFTYKIEKKRADKDKEETAKQMKEFAEMMKKQNQQ